MSTDKKQDVEDKVVELDSDDLDTVAGGRKRLPKQEDPCAGGE